MTPHNELTQMADSMLAHVEGYEGRRAIVMLTEPTENEGENRSGLGMHGYEDEAEVIMDIYVQLRALCRSVGRDCLLVLPDAEVEPEGDL